MGRLICVVQITQYKIFTRRRQESESGGEGHVKPEAKIGVVCFEVGGRGH